MSKIMNFFNKKRKELSSNIKSYNEAKEKDSGLAGAKKNAMIIKIVIAAVPVVFFGACVVIIIMAALAPMIVITGVVADIGEAVSNFGSSVGNWFTSGCYGTDEECAKRREADAEKTFKDTLGTIWDIYYLNTDKKMDGYLDDKYSTTSEGFARYRYNVNVNLPVLVSALLSPTEGYYDLLYGSNMLEEVLGEKILDVSGRNYTWFLAEGDQTGIDYDKLNSKLENVTSSNPCGNYNEIYSKAAEGEEGYSDIILRYKPKEPSFLETIGSSIIGWFTTDDEFSQMRVMSKYLTTRKVVTSCSVANDENGNPSKNIKTYVSYEYDEKEYRNYLINHYLVQVLREKYLNEQFKVLLEGYDYTIINNTIVKKDYSELTSEDTKKLRGLQNEFDTKLTEVMKNYMPSLKDREQAADEIISNGEYYEYILDEILSKRASKTKVCTSLTVEHDDLSIEGPLPIDTYISGLIQSLNDKYGAAVNDEVIKAEAVILRTYILIKTDFCADTLKVDSTPLKDNYSSTPTEDLQEKVQETRGRVLVGSDGELLYNSNPSNLEFLYESKVEQEKVLNEKLSSKAEAGTNDDKIYEANLEDNKIMELAGVTSITLNNKISVLAISKIYEKMPVKEQNFETLLVKVYVVVEKVDVSVDRCGGNLVGGKYSSSAPSYDCPSGTSCGGSDAGLSEATYTDGSKIYTTATGLMGQCVWYAKTRALEIVYYSDMPEDIRNAAYKAVWRANGNGGGWSPYNSVLAENFETSFDLYDVRAGSFISWSGGNAECSSCYRDYKGKSHCGCGHVAILEEVLADGRVVISDGWSSDWKVKAWSSVRYRKNTYTIGQILTMSYNFNGYVYLLG